MSSDPKKWVKPRRNGRMKGVMLYINQEVWEDILKHCKIPIDTPLDDLRYTRYATKSRNIIVRVKHIDKIQKDELEMTR